MQERWVVRQGMKEVAAGRSPSVGNGASDIKQRSGSLSLVVGSEEGEKST